MLMKMITKLLLCAGADADEIAVADIAAGVIAVAGGYTYGTTSWSL